MISLIATPEKIIEGLTLKVKLEIKGTINLKMYKGTYFNLIIKKNGGTLGSKTLYPLRFNGFPIEWDINPYTYGSSGTFNVGCVIQDSNQNPITTTTFIIEPLSLIKKQNLTQIEQTKRFKDSQIKKQEIPIDYTGGCLIQKIGTSIKIEENKLPINNSLCSSLLSSVKVQKATKNVN